MTSSSAVRAEDLRPTPFPLRLADADTFRQVERALRSANFHEGSICRALSIKSMADIGTVQRTRLDAEPHLSSTLALLLRLFLLVERVPRDDVTRVIDRSTLEALLALDLLRAWPSASGSEEYYSPVLLYPVEGLLIASDSHANPDGSPFVPPPDAVFPAIFGGTLRFLRLLPRSPAWDVLDLCAGTGIGALVLSHQARHAVAADITPRAAHFARFNCLLNCRHNVEVATGDLYDAVSGRTFDRIIAHPPYVPAASTTQIFRDGGETGELVLRRIIAGLADALRPAGTFHALCAGWDTKEGPFEERVRRWLGAREEEFDVLFAVHHEMSPADVARGLSERASSTEPAQLGHWRTRFDAAGMERCTYGALVLERRPQGPPGGRPITRRMRLSALTDGAAFERLLRWLRWREAQEGQRALAQVLLAASLRLSPQARVNVSYLPQGDGLAAADVVLETDCPFSSLTRIDPWLLPLVARFDGAHTTERVYELAAQAGEVVEGFGRYDLATLVALMLERGYLELDEAALMLAARVRD